MNARETAAYAAGIETARQMALTAAITLEVREDANEVRQQAAAAALHGLAEGLRAALLDPQRSAPSADPSRSDLIRSAIAAIAADPAQAGEIPCPTCGARLRWGKDSSNGHIHAECETPNCLRVMQ